MDMYFTHAIVQTVAIIRWLFGDSATTDYYSRHYSISHTLWDSELYLDNSQCVMVHNININCNVCISTLSETCRLSITQQLHSTELLWPKWITTDQCKPLWIHNKWKYANIIVDTMLTIFKYLVNGILSLK